MRRLLILVVGTFLFTACDAPFAGASTQSKPAPKASTTVKSTAVKKPTPTSSTAKPVAGPSKDEQAIFDAANRERAERQLPPLKWDAKLAAAARTHAQKMAQAGTLSHQFPGEMDMGTRFRVAGVRFSSAAENVAQAPSADVLHKEWMDSAPHRANILDPELDSLGVAVVSSKGQMFAVQDFARASQ